MSFETLTGGLELVIPNSNTRNWGEVVKNATWKKINDHTHTGGGDGNKLGGSSFADNSIGKDQLAKNLAGFINSVAVSGASVAIDLNEGNIVDLDLDGATGLVALTVANPIAGGVYRFIFRQGATERLISWPANFKFPGGEEPTQYSSASSVNEVIALYDGTDFLSDWKLNYS